MSSVVDNKPPVVANSGEALQRTLQFVSEAVIPGGSNFVKGDLLNGVLYTVLGLAAKSIFGVPGLLLVSANSFTKARTGLSIFEHIHHSADAGRSVPVTPAGPATGTTGAGR